VTACAAPAAGPSPAGGVQAPRVIFIDLARSLAVLFMLYGHAVSALLAPEYRAGAWFDVWQFQRGLTAVLFLLLSGFAFSVATTRRWSEHLAPSRRLAHRLRRFLFYVLLGYGLHLPVGRLVELPQATAAQWQTFLAVDVLQLVGTSFIAVQLLVMVTRRRAVFTGVALALTAAVVAATPAVWRVDWTAHLPLWAASFLSPATGSLFPVFPWGAYILLGAALGQVYGRWGAAHLTPYANWVLMVPGVLMFVAGRLLRPLQTQVFGAGGFSHVPPEVLIRAGAALMIIGLIAYASRHLERLPRAFGAVAQETLVIYFVHLCIVYGSVWNVGLVRVYGQTLAPLPMLGVVVVLISSMVALAWVWNQMKHRAPGRARWVAALAAAALLVRLL
jgi:uncharacterized membrane protein